MVTARTELRWRIEENQAKARLLAHRMRALAAVWPRVRHVPGGGQEHFERTVRVYAAARMTETDRLWVAAMQEAGISNELILQAWERKDELSRSSRERLSRPWP